MNAKAELGTKVALASLLSSECCTSCHGMWVVMVSELGQKCETLQGRFSFFLLSFFPLSLSSIKLWSDVFSGAKVRHP